MADLVLPMTPLWPFSPRGYHAAMVPGVVLAAQGQNFGSYLLVLGVMIVVIVLATAGLMWFRSRVLGRGGMVEPHSGLLTELRELRDRGEITTEEYDAARQAMVARVAGTPSSPPPVKTPEKPPRTPTSGAGELRARPGYDLTGRPLPGTSQADPGQ